MSASSSRVASDTGGDTIIEALRREIDARDAFLAQASAGLARCVERLAATGADVDEIRAFARELSIIAGDEAARAPRRVELDAAAHVAVVVEEWRTRKGGACEIAVARTTSVDAVGAWDPALLDTILGELISNGCKYGRGAPVTVHVDSDAVSVRLIVDDEGIGIDAGESGGRRFTRGSNTGEAPGFGVGVWLARLLAEAHGGTLRLEPRSPAGTRAIVELPRG